MDSDTLLAKWTRQSLKYSSKKPKTKSFYADKILELLGFPDAHARYHIYLQYLPYDLLILIAAGLECRGGSTPLGISSSGVQPPHSTSPETMPRGKMRD